MATPPLHEAPRPLRGTITSKILYLICQSRGLLEKKYLVVHLRIAITWPCGAYAAAAGGREWPLRGAGKGGNGVRVAPREEAARAAPP